MDFSGKTLSENYIINFWKTDSFLTLAGRPEFSFSLKEAFFVTHL